MLFSKSQLNSRWPKPVHPTHFDYSKFGYCPKRREHFVLDSIFFPQKIRTLFSFELINNIREFHSNFIDRNFAFRF